MQRLRHDPTHSQEDNQHPIAETLPTDPAGEYLGEVGTVIEAAEDTFKLNFQRLLQRYVNSTCKCNSTYR